LFVTKTRSQKYDKRTIQTANARRVYGGVGMKKIYYCEHCEKPATYTIQPEGGRLSYWCTKHFNKRVKELEK
jgi:hypothetical protein